jgi:hypothetical protein
MPDAACKVNIFFKASGGTAPTGWTETFWSTITSLQDNIDQVVKIYVPKRAALLGVGAEIQYVRAAKVPPNRITQVSFLSGLGKIGAPSLFTTSPADDYDPTQVDLLCRVTDTSGHRRQLWIAGLPDSQTDQLLNQGITGAFISSPAWKQYQKAVNDCGFCIRSKVTNGPPPTFAANQIATIDPIMVRNRKKGRPFELFRGRRLA